jgi:hypothetical protein
MELAGASSVVAVLRPVGRAVEVRARVAAVSRRGVRCIFARISLFGMIKIGLMVDEGGKWGRVCR